MLPISPTDFESAVKAVDILDVSTATIRQICALAAALEEKSGEDFVHLEIGNPGLAPEVIGIDAECAALRRGVANKYPRIDGIPEVKEAGSKFVKAFLDVDIDPECIIPTVGSMQASFTLMLLLAQREKGKDTMVYIQPGFPATYHQAKVLGIRRESFDLYDYRGKKLEEKLRSILDSGRVTGIVYSNPNNPAWTNLTDEELEIIGRLATEYDAIVLEDLAYMTMDFRRDLGRPYEPPFVSTVARYTDNYILLVSASKIFSYAGERIAVACISNAVYHRRYQALADFYEMPAFGEAYIYGVLYTASSGVAHSGQYALAAMMNAACEGKLKFRDNCLEYGNRAAKVKKIFRDNGFHLVYEMDGPEEISDGFFFTVGYGSMSSAELQQELLRHGVSAITLPSTGSTQEGVRVCVSAISRPEQYEMLEERIKAFHDEHRH